MAGPGGAGKTWHHRALVGSVPRGEVRLIEGVGHVTVQLGCTDAVLTPLQDQRRAGEG